VTTTTTTIKVLVVADHPSTRLDLARALEADGDVTVVGRCECGGALDAVRAYRPDLVALTGSKGSAATTALESIMAYAPTPIIVLRSPTELTFAAERHDIEAGAVGVLGWAPSPGNDSRLRERVRVLRRATVVRHPRASVRSSRNGRATSRPAETCHPIVGMAASTGGPHTLVEVVRGLAELTAPVLIVQHMHPEFIEGFAEWIGRASGASVVIAAHGMTPEPGAFYIAPAGFHLKVNAHRRLVLDAHPATLHRPSANELFLSMAEHLKRDAVGVLLTGMGDDGASGLLAVHRAGGATIVQDGASSAIDGMPRAARELGAAGVVAALPDIPRAVHRALGART
jgi:two-component system chemotaxis response regulator CheB